MTHAESAPESAEQPNAAEYRDDTPDVVPPVVSQGLALAALLLIGGRGIFVPFALDFGLLTRETVESFDKGWGARLYLLLLAGVTVTASLRAVRALSPATARPSGPRASAGEENEIS